MSSVNTGKITLAFIIVALAISVILPGVLPVADAQQGGQEKSQTRIRDPSSHNQVLQERWRNQTETSGAVIHIMHMRLGAPTTEEYPSDLRYSLSANGTAKSFEDNSTENVSITMQFATWKSSNRVVSMDILNGMIKIGEKEETVQAGHGYYVMPKQMLMIYGLVPYEGDNGAPYVKILKIVSTSSFENELPSEESDPPYAFESSLNSRLDAEYYLSLIGEVALTASGPTETAQKVNVSSGDEFTVELESNPTTGYEWQVVQIEDEAIVRLVDSEYVPPDSDLLGASGKEVFTFEALEEGNTKVTLEYARQFEESPIARHAVDVTVGGRGELLLTTDKPEYMRGEAVLFTATNHGPETLIFPGSALGMQIENLETGSTYGVIGTAALTPIEPGQSRQVTWSDTEGADVGNYIAIIHTVADEESTAATAEVSFKLN